LWDVAVKTATEAATALVKINEGSMHIRPTSKKAETGVSVAAANGIQSFRAFSSAGQCAHEGHERDARPVCRTAGQKNAIGIAAKFVLTQSGHWTAKDLHEYMAKSMFYEEARTEEFPNEEKRDLRRNRAYWA
jgi:hypothetical protein